LLNSQTSAFKIIGYYVGKIITVLAILQILPIITSIVYKEWDIVFDFTISMSLALILGSLLVIFFNSARRRKIDWSHGMIIAALSWFAGMILCAIPYYLSGNFNSFLDSLFYVMSGFTTTGVVLIQDLDHVSNGINMWRHVLTYLG